MTRKAHVPAETFIEVYCEAYQKNESQAYVAEKLDIGTAGVSARAKSLRNRGVALPKLINQKASTASTEALKDLVQKLLPGVVVEAADETQPEPTTETEVEAAEPTETTDSPLAAK